MQVVLLMHICESLERLEHDVANHLLGEKLAALLHQLVYVEVQVFEDIMESVSFEDHLVELDDVGVRQLHQ